MRTNPWRARRSWMLGFTLLEVMVAAGVLAIAITGLLAVLTSTSRMQRSNRQTTLALNAIRDKLEELRNYPNFNEFTLTQGGSRPDAEPALVDYYRSTTVNPRTNLLNSQFAVTGLNADRSWSLTTDDTNGNGLADMQEPGDSEGDSVVGAILLFTDETATDADAVRVGMPIDCDGDGATITTNTVVDADSNQVYDYHLVPVTVRIEWRSGNGSRAMQVSTKLARRQ